MSTPAVQNLTVVKGDDLTVVVEAVLSSMAPLTANQWTATARWRSAFDSPTYTAFTTAVTAIDDDTYGVASVLRVAITMPAAATTILPTSVWTLQMTYPTGELLTWVRGQLTPL